MRFRRKQKSPNTRISDIIGHAGARALENQLTDEFGGRTFDQGMLLMIRTAAQQHINERAAMTGREAPTLEAFTLDDGRTIEIREQRD